jgi:flagellar biosynthetic protein FliP
MAGTTVVTPAIAHAQNASIDLHDLQQAGLTGHLIQIILLITVLSLAPGILVTVTSFTRIIVVMSLLRSALGGQQTPPNVVLISLSLFLSFYVMAPVMQHSYDEGVAPLLAQRITEEQAIVRIGQPFHDFMRRQASERDIALFMDLAKIDKVAGPEALPYRVLIPAFMVGELRRAFEMGFLIFLPFVIIDMVVASVLMSMGMMFLPPVMIALPFKLIFFVLVDGWYLVAGSLVRSFGS